VPKTLFPYLYLGQTTNLWLPSNKVVILHENEANCLGKLHEKNKIPIVNRVKLILFIKYLQQQTLGG